MKESKNKKVARDERRYSGSSFGDEESFEGGEDEDDPMSKLMRESKEAQNEI